MPGKSTPFTPSSILFRPREQESAIRYQDRKSRAAVLVPEFPIPDSWNWWSRRVLPPGPKGLLRRPFIAIAGLRRPSEYKRKRLSKKDRRLAHSRPAGRKNGCGLNDFDEFPGRFSRTAPCPARSGDRPAGLSWRHRQARCARRRARLAAREGHSGSDRQA